MYAAGCCQGNSAQCSDIKITNFNSKAVSWKKSNILLANAHKCSVFRDDAFSFSDNCLRLTHDTQFEGGALYQVFPVIVLSTMFIL